MPISGGSPEFLFDAGVNLHDIACAKRPPSTMCVIAKRDQKGMVFSTLDLSTRQRRDLAKVEHARDWDVSYDGSRIAILIKDQGKSSIRIVHPSGETEREFIVEQSGVEIINCSVDGKGLYLSVTPQPGVSALYYTDLRGTSPLALAAERQVWVVRVSAFPRWPLPCYGGSYGRHRCLVARKLLSCRSFAPLCFSSARKETPCKKTIH